MVFTASSCHEGEFRYLRLFLQYVLLIEFLRLQETVIFIAAYGLYCLDVEFWKVFVHIVLKYVRVLSNHEQA